MILCYFSNAKMRLTLFFLKFKLKSFLIILESFEKANIFCDRTCQINLENCIVCLTEIVMNSLFHVVAGVRTVTTNWQVRYTPMLLRLLKNIKAVS